jgi:hypothetical protein
MNLPPFGLRSYRGAAQTRLALPVKVKAAYLNLTFVLKCLPSRIIKSSSRQVPAQALLVDQLY